MSIVDRQELLDHYQNPRNSGKPEKFDLSLSLKNKSCGDDITVFIRLAEPTQDATAPRADNPLAPVTQVVSSINYELRGCALSLASASMLSQELAGLTKEQILAFSSEQLEELVGKLTITRSKCAHLPLDAIKQAISLQS